MTILSGKKILLGLGGSIAAYKIPELIRQLQAENATVRVIMTQAATAFMTPLTLSAISGYPVYTELLAPISGTGMDHIELARWADVILIAPATANLMARLSVGLADDLLTTVCLATTVPICLAPAMNSNMWTAPATVANQNILRARGVHFFGPGPGLLACGEQGVGRLETPGVLIVHLKKILRPQILAGHKVLITAGPTREAIDPVRFLSNRSSGKMGYALANAAIEMGASVTLVSGPTALPPPVSAVLINVLSAKEMFEAVMKHIADQTLFIGCAAIADYRPVISTDHKIKKHGQETLTLILERTEDCLAAVAALPKPPFTVGFAAETNQIETYALEKLQRKGIDMIVANEVGRETIGFESDENAFQVYWKNGKQLFPRELKKKLAYDLMKLIADQFGGAF